MAEPLLRRWLDVWIPLVVVVLDQLTKAVVRASLQLHESVNVIPGMLDFTHIRNTGAAFGLLNNTQFPYKTFIISLVAVAGLIGIGVYSAGLPRQQVLARTGLSLVLGGAAGNLIDRFTEGSVVDFVDVYWRSYHFWAFNVADSAITVGVALMILDILAGFRVSKAV